MAYLETKRLALPLMVLALMGGTACAQSGKVDIGKQEYVENCAVCHGTNGKGGGPYAELLRRTLPDLTQLARNNGGVFPVNRMYETIEGADVPSHGTRDMPIWGLNYRIKAAEYYADMDYKPEPYVRARILALIEYINRLQVR